MIGTWRKSQELYYLNRSPAACISVDSPKLIHKRFGHPSLFKIQKMVPQLSTLLIPECESCQLREHTRMSFPKHLNKQVTSPFELVHSDVWGPSRIPATLCFWYFVTFIDDFSCCNWIFLMKERSELFSMFQKNCAEIHTQFNISICTLRSDNAKEYFPTSFTSCLTQYGILHQSTCYRLVSLSLEACTHISTKCSWMENHHLVEVARTILLHNRVPLHFWGDGVLIACYLMNHMPSSTFNKGFHIPFSFLHNPLSTPSLCHRMYLFCACSQAWTG